MRTHSSFQNLTPFLLVNFAWKRFIDHPEKILCMKQVGAMEYDGIKDCYIVDGRPITQFFLEKFNAGDSLVVNFLIF